VRYAQLPPQIEGLIVSLREIQAHLRELYAVDVAPT